MKKNIVKRGLGVGLALVLACSLVPAAAMAEETADAGEYGITTYASEPIDVTDYGANGSDTLDDTSAIQSALNLAKTTEGEVTVYVPSGTYYINKILHIYSDTTLLLDDNATIKADNTVMLRAYYIVDDEERGGYTKAENITVSGGTWDGNYSSGKTAANGFQFHHCQNITIENLTIQNIGKEHHLEFDAVKDATVKNCTFKDLKDSTATNELGTDAVNVEYASEATATASVPYDYTPCENITVTNCEFINCHSGVGSGGHYEVSNGTLTVTNNTFTNMTGSCVDHHNVESLTVTGNTATNVNAFLVSRYNGSGSSITISNNTATLGNSTSSVDAWHGIDVRSCPNVTIKNNTLKGAGQHAIYAFDATVTITGNEITNSNYDGIRASGCKVNISGNDISNSNKSKGSDYRDITVWTSSGISCSGTVKYNCDEDVLIESNVSSSAVHNYVNGVCTRCGAKQSGTSSGSGTSSSGATVKKASDGKWYYYNASGKKDTSYTGFASNSNGKWYVEKGVVTFKTNGVLKDKTGAIGTKNAWYYVDGSKVQTSYTGVANYKNSSGWWYVVNGKVDFSANTVAKNKNGWWYVLGGKVQFGFTGLANYRNSNGWWYIVKGKVDFKHNGVDKNKNGWWYVEGGKVQMSYNGVSNYKNKNGWWYIKNGKVDFSFNGRASNKYGTWNVVNGKVKF